METVRKKRILVVDDDKDFRDIMIKYLTDMGYEIIDAENGLEGLFKIREKGVKPDLIMLDIVMDTLNGIDTFQLIKENDILKEIPVIFISGSEVYNKFKQKTNLKNINFLAKPIVFPALNSLLEKLLKDKRKK